VTLADILERAKVPRFIHYVSLDIEGEELFLWLLVVLDDCLDSKVEADQ